MLCSGELHPPLTGVEPASSLLCAGHQAEVSSTSATIAPQCREGNRTLPPDIPVPLRRVTRPMPDASQDDIGERGHGRTVSPALSRYKTFTPIDAKGSRFFHFFSMHRDGIAPSSSAGRRSVCGHIPLCYRCRRAQGRSISNPARFHPAYGSPDRSLIPHRARYRLARAKETSIALEICASQYRTGRTRTDTLATMIRLRYPLRHSPDAWRRTRTFDTPQGNRFTACLLCRLHIHAVWMLTMHPLSRVSPLSSHLSTQVSAVAAHPLTRTV